MTSTDDLTGLLNRRALDACMGDDDLGVVFIGLDNFKAINDAYGLRQGDVVLCEVAKVLQANSREVDRAARVGGDEFVVLLSGTDSDGAFDRAERIREDIARLSIARLDGFGTLSVTASCGVAAGETTAADASAPMAAADMAHFQAKGSGKNRSVRAS